MTETPQPGDGSTERGDEDRADVLADGGEIFKILGELDDAGGIGVLGRATAATGTTYGVKGAVDSPDGYGLYTPDDAKIDGTVESADEWRVETEDGDGDAGNVVVGDPSNDADSGASGATVVGGTANSANANQATVVGGASNSASEFATTVTGGLRNTASQNYATISGGDDNVASGNGAAVGGGGDNTASAAKAVVSGGYENEATGYGAAVGGGDSNEASSQFATIAGGGPTDLGNRDTTNNVVHDDYGTIAGGGGNQAGDDATDSEYATVGGGRENTASGPNSTIAGGDQNTASGTDSAVGGGASNVASDSNATVAGGNTNVASASQSTISGGTTNEANGLYSSIGGGYSNLTGGTVATVGGGEQNEATAIGATVGGGSQNTATSNNTTIGGGGQNEADGLNATVAGGYSNTATGSYSTVPGGRDNVSSGDYSFAAGRNATATHDGAVVFGDSSSTQVTSGSTDEARFQMDARVDGELTVNADASSIFSYVRFGSSTGSNPRMYYSNSSEAFTLADAEELRTYMDIRSVGDTNPYHDGGSSLGTGSARWSEVWAVNGTVQTSDARLKTNVIALDDGLDRVQALRPVSFEWTDGDGEENLGLIAQEVEEVVPEAVERPDDEDGYLGVTYQTLVPVLVDAVQHQQDDLESKDERIEELEAASAQKDGRIADLEARTEALEERLSALEGAAGARDSVPADD